ncbi:MAG: hypothetical protein E5X76_22485 [Mesorhizobium sp.]|nr:MAG: hypothetical protein E5X76_22485 [Mesorhizobium sp.]
MAFATQKLKALGLQNVNVTITTDPAVGGMRAVSSALAGQRIILAVSKIASLTPATNARDLPSSYQERSHDLSRRKPAFRWRRASFEQTSGMVGNLPGQERGKRRPPCKASVSGTDAGEPNAQGKAASRIARMDLTVLSPAGSGEESDAATDAPAAAGDVESA